jgi:hypothetical protein
VGKAKEERARGVAKITLLDFPPCFGIIAVDFRSPIIARRKVMAWRLNETPFHEGEGMGFLFFKGLPGSGEE